MIDEVDEYRNGSIDFVEFLTMMARKNSDVDSLEEVRRAFNSFDTDKNGYISAHELQSVLANLGDIITEQQAIQLIHKVDLDGDGFIDFDEFYQLISYT